ncbi:MAG TPA: hypothetical protein VNH46_09725 [Gemmatimonadales bacterium]|nr:hypothetical protein [Gemmatimonadales bacterium]
MTPLSALGLISHDEAQLVAIILVMVLALVGVVRILGPIARAFARRIEGKAGDPEVLQAQIDELRGRMQEAEAREDRLLELEERLDFAERLLARQRDPARIEPGG